MKVLVTGATGFVGRKLINSLVSNDHSVVILSRDKDSALKKFDGLQNIQAFSWNPINGLPPQEAFDGVEAVVNLMGENISARRWSDDQKERILASRETGTSNLVQAIDKFCDNPLSVFISASAIGYYVANLQDELDEGSPKGDSFLADVCDRWEKAANKVQKADRTVNLRIGVVLGKDGGALEKLAPIFKLGGGGPIGSGSMQMSWIHVDDLVGIIEYALSEKNMSKVVNAVSPQPVSNLIFSKALAKSLSRPCIFPVPPFMLKLVYGEMSQIMLDSQRILPRALMQSGYEFKYPEIDKALDQLYRG